MKIEKENGYLKYSVDDMNENEYVIDMVEVYNKRQGTGTQLVKEMIDIARRDGKELGLCAYPQDDSISYEDLLNFYIKLGFIVEYDDGEEAIMKYEF